MFDRIPTCGSEPSHNPDPVGAGFGPPESLEKRFLPKIGDRGVVGVEGAVDSVSSDATDSGGGDGLWRNCLRTSFGTSSSASRSSTPTREKGESVWLSGVGDLRTRSGKPLG